MRRVSPPARTIGITGRFHINLSSNSGISVSTLGSSNNSSPSRALAFPDLQNVAQGSVKPNDLLFKVSYYVSIQYP